jgi:anti-sigma factor RsiW
MSDPKPPLSEQEREDLSAYLDNELDDETAQAVEARLNVDEKVRAEADALKRTWDMLDYLPRAEPSPSFTHRTMSRISALRPAATQPARADTPGPPWRRRLGWAAAMALAAAAGFAAVTFLLPPDRTDEELARDLRVIENRRLYEPIDDIDFLHALEQPDLFGEDTTGG